MFFKRNIWFLLACIILVACADPQNKPKVSVLASEDPQGTGWWKALDDNRLNYLVAKGREDAYDIRLAITQLTEAKALLRSEKSNLIPSVNLSLNATDALTGTGALDLNWQLDLFGAVRNSIKAAEARAGSSQALIADTRRLITAGIVSTYIQLRARQFERRLAEKSAARISETVNNITRLMQAGYATKLDQTRSKRQLAEINARIKSIAGTERALQNGIRTIIGSSVDTGKFKYNSGDENLLFSRPDIPKPIAEHLFIDRPDIRAAALTLNAEGYEKISAERALYPTISFQGNAISNSSDIASFQFGGISTALATSIVLPLLGRGQFLAQIDAETAQKERALVNYERTVMIVATEIDTSEQQALSSRLSADETKKALQEATAALQQSKRLFDAGEISYLDVLLSEQSLIDAEQSLVASEEAAALAWTQYMTSLALQ